LKKTSKTLTNRAIKDFHDIEKEINALMSMYLKKKFEMSKPHRGKGAVNKNMAMQMFALFCEENIFRYEKPALRRAIAEYLGSKYTPLSVKKLIERAKKENKNNELFSSLYKMTESLGIKIVTEGWIRSPSMQVKFIERQISKLETRRDIIKEKAL